MQLKYNIQSKTSEEKKQLKDRKAFKYNGYNK